MALPSVVSDRAIGLWRAASQAPTLRLVVAAIAIAARHRAEGGEMARQFVIQLDNRVGELAHLARALAARGIDIRHVSCFGTGSLACAFMVPDDPLAMRRVLDGLGYEYIEGEPIIVPVEDRPGGLADVAERLAAAGILISGTMCVGQGPGIIEMAFTVDDVGRAREALGLDERVPAGAAG